MRLNALNPDHIEGRVVRVRAALDTNDLAEARAVLEVVGEHALDARICALWAELEDVEHGPGFEARKWLLRASRAPAGPTWTCSDCGKNTIDWIDTCPHCEAFDTLSWAPAGPAVALRDLDTPPLPPPPDSRSNPNFPVVSSDSEPQAVKDEEKLLAPPVPDVPAADEDFMGRP